MKRLLTRSLAATITPETTDFRRRELEAMQHPVSRAAALKLNGMVQRNPDMVAKFLGIDYRPRPLRAIGQGWHSVVLLNGEDEVLKVNQRTLLYTATERAAFVERKRHEHEAMAEHLGSFVLPQEIFAAIHPVFRNREVVEITQPFRTIVNPNIFYKGCTASSIESSVQDLRIDYPSAAAQLTSYAEQSHALYDDTGLLPDSCGGGNLVLGFPDGDLLMIDGQPVGRDEPDIQGIILNNLTHLEQALA